jgi:hypothetical protein
MSDLVQELRGVDTDLSASCECYDLRREPACAPCRARPLLREAAAEIERLREVNAALVEIANLARDIVLADLGELEDFPCSPREALRRINAALARAKKVSPE